MKSEIFKRPLIECNRDDRIFIDSAIKNMDYVNSFGFEWTKIDGFVGKETMSHGHLFGRFLLPSDYFKGKNVFDIGFLNCLQQFGRSHVHAHEQWIAPSAIVTLNLCPHLCVHCPG